MTALLSFAPLAPYVITLIVIGAVLGAVIVWLAVCTVIASKTLKMATRPVAHTIEEARERQVETEHIDIDAYDNKWSKQPFEIDGLHGKLRGEIIVNPADNGSRHRVAVIAHGHSWNRINSIKYATIFYNCGFSVVLYDHSYFGLSDGKFCTLGYYERKDLSTVIDYSREIFGHDCIIALHGESMGAVTVLSVLGLRSDIDLVVADCPFSDTFSYYKELYTHLTHMPAFPVVEISGLLAKAKFGYDYSGCRPIDDVKQSDTPICFIHGLDDDFIYPHHSEDMYKVCKNPMSELHLVEGARHACSHLKDNEAYAKIVRNFVDKVLKND